MRLFSITLLLAAALTAGCDFGADRRPLNEAGDEPLSPTPPARPDRGLDRAGKSDHDEGSARPPGRPDTAGDRQQGTFPRPRADQMIPIPGGTLLAGSPPDDALRVQFAENDLVPHTMTPFEIDALPFPNDPDRVFLTGVTRDEAGQACREAGKRLCTELEWERACKSNENLRYPTGARYDSGAWTTQDRLSPASAFGVFGMGRLLEWTSSAWGAEQDQVERAVARGFAPGFGEPPERGRRCAKRWRRMHDGSDPALGFRCCRGPVNPAACFIEPTRPAFSAYNNMKPEKFASIIRSIKQLASLHDNPHMFSESDLRTVLARRDSNREALAAQGIHFRWIPLRWIPRQGTELWVAVGRSNAHGFVVALHETKDNEAYAHASSLVLWNQPTPLALVYREGHRDELFWAPCWNCRDGGRIAFDDEKNEVIITHRW